MELMQVQSQQLSYQQIQGLKLLQMSSWELEQYLRELSQENPLVDLEPETPSVEEKDELLHYLQWLEDNDYQNLYCQQVNEDELDPLSRVGTEGGLEETLFRFLSRQLYTMDLEEELADAVRYLASSLDERGYLAAPMAEPGRAVPERPRPPPPAGAGAGHPPGAGARRGRCGKPVPVPGAAAAPHPGERARPDHRAQLPAGAGKAALFLHRG